VLGADSLRDVLGASSYWRSVYAVRAWREGGFSTVVVTGGPADLPISERMRDYIVSQGVPVSAILVETHSQSTRGERSVLKTDNRIPARQEGFVDQRLSYVSRLPGIPESRHRCSATSAARRSKTGQRVGDTLARIREFMQGNG